MGRRKRQKTGATYSSEEIKVLKTGDLSDDDDVLIEHCTDVLENNELCQNLHHATLEKAAQILDIKTYKEALVRKHWIRFIGRQCKETIGGEEVLA